MPIGQGMTSWGQIGDRVSTKQNQVRQAEVDKEGWRQKGKEAIVTKVASRQKGERSKVGLIPI